MKRLLIAGCGDVATRALPLLAKTYRLCALARSTSEVARLRGLGVEASLADLDYPKSLSAVDFNADCVLHSVPPPGAGVGDVRTRHLIEALLRAADAAGATARDDSGAQPKRRIVYLSTSGVYGDCKGEWVDETRAVNPMTPRAARRVDAERQLQYFTQESGLSLVILRVPGIYAADRLPLERLRGGTPVLRAKDDVYSNHIHAEDLASIIAIACQAENTEGIFNTSDDTEMKMGDYFDLVADRHGLSRPPRISRADAAREVSPELLSFWNESRRLVNARMKTRLGVTLRYPTVSEGVPTLVEVR
ncbi:MAG: SDR family oxidoreductase [Burkholderiales bacterium]